MSNIQRENTASMFDSRKFEVFVLWFCCTVSNIENLFVIKVCSNVGTTLKYHPQLNNIVAILSQTEFTCYLGMLYFEQYLGGEALLGAYNFFKTEICTVLWDSPIRVLLLDNKHCLGLAGVELNRVFCSPFQLFIQDLSIDVQT